MFPSNLLLIEDGYKFFATRLIQRWSPIPLRIWADFQWLAWSIIRIGGDILAFPMRGHKKFWGFDLSLLKHLFWGPALQELPLWDQMSCCENQATWRMCRLLVRSSSWAPSREKAPACLLTSMQITSLEYQTHLSLLITVAQRQFQSLSSTWKQIKLSTGLDFYTSLFPVILLPPFSLISSFRNSILSLTLFWHSFILLSLELKVSIWKLDWMYIKIIGIYERKKCP